MKKTLGQHNIYFKILGDFGESIHGGKNPDGTTFRWNLPTKKGRKWIPGAWHVVSRRQSIAVCATGFHVTWSPEYWDWGQARRCFVAEIGHERDCEASDLKLCARRVRLLKEVAFKQSSPSFRRILSIERRKHKEKRVGRL